MKKIVCLVGLICCLGSSAYGEDTKSPKKYFSAGFLDHKTGTSFVGYARTLVGNDEHELFVGVGSALALNTLAIGWKYTFWHSYVNLYAVLAAHAMAGMGKNIIYAPFWSAGFEKKLTTNWFVNVGVNTTVRLYIKDYQITRKTEFIVYPNVNLNYRWN